MGFFSSIKKLFGFGQQDITLVEPIQEAEIVEEVVMVPVVKEVQETVVNQPVVEEATSVKVEEQKNDTVGEIKSKSRRSKPTTSVEQNQSKPKKPYRRPRPKKEKPSE
jgi:hypothetical protein